MQRKLPCRLCWCAYLNPSALAAVLGVACSGDHEVMTVATIVCIPCSTETRTMQQKRPHDNAMLLLQPQPLTEYVASHQGAVWAVGPLFAAVTGVVFKEGVCYGKPECAVLFFLTPALLIGMLLHTTSIPIYS